MIEIRHLRYFIAIAEELNFRRAAERVHIDQTPLSRAARDLEEELGVQLLVRGHRRLQLTPAGAKLLSEARKLMVRLERIKRAVRITHAFYKAPLRIGIADDLAQPRLFECLERWRDVAPDVPLELIELRARELLAALTTENVDVGFSFGLPEDDAITQLPVWCYPLMAALPAEHELAGNLTVSLADLLAFPLIRWSRERYPGLASQVQGVIEIHSGGTTFAGEACTVTGFVTRLAMGAGVGMIDSGNSQVLQLSNASVRPLSTEECVTTFAAFKAKRFASEKAVQSFLTHVGSFY